MNVKPGDLAIVIKSAPGNQGAIVQVLSLEEKNMAIQGKCLVWKCHSHRDLLGIDANGIIGIFPAGNDHYFSDDQLRPVSGLSDPEFQEKEINHKVPT